ncbi:MAG: glyoxalase [Acidobacteria bacterium]|nr:glyoxalase [Acidobacteriota bacterium]
MTIVHSSATAEAGGTPFLAIDHVQLAMPPGGEAKARAFYGGLLGMTEIEKPVALAARGGCWFRSGVVELHLGVQENFHPAIKAHPALRCANYDMLSGKIRQAGVSLQEAIELTGIRRCHIFDPFGNRIELLGP